MIAPHIKLLKTRAGRAAGGGEEGEVGSAMTALLQENAV